MYAQIIKMATFEIGGFMKKYLESGMDDYLSKTIDIREF